jgi:hypothetical protein
MATTVTRAEALCAAQDAMNKLVAAAGVTCVPGGSPPIVPKPAVKKPAVPKPTAVELLRLANEAILAATKDRTGDKIAAATAAVAAYKGHSDAIDDEKQKLQIALDNITRSDPPPYPSPANVWALVTPLSGNSTDAEFAAADAAFESFKAMSGKKDSDVMDLSTAITAAKAAKKETDDEKAATANYIFFRHKDVNHFVPKNIDTALKAVQNSTTRQELSDNEIKALTEIGKYATTNKSDADKLIPVLNSIVAAKNKEFDDAEREAEREAETARLLQVARELLSKVAELKDIIPASQAANEAYGYAKEYKLSTDQSRALQQEIANREKELMAANAKVAANAKAAANAKVAANAKAAAATSPKVSLADVSKKLGESGRKVTYNGFIDSILRAVGDKKGDDILAPSIQTRLIKLREQVNTDGNGLTPEQKTQLNTYIDTIKTGAAATLDKQIGGRRRTRSNKKKARRTTRRS